MTSEASCPFCDVPRPQIVAASTHGVAIHDAYPVAEDHTLVLPKRHVASVFELPIPVQRDLWELAAQIRAELAGQPDVDGFNIGVNDGTAAGQTVPHAHIHVIPRREGDVDDPRGGIRWVRPDRAAYWDE